MNLAEDVLFVGQSADASFYHRIMLPALTLGCDWCGLDSPPPEMTIGRGEVRFADDRPDLASYRVVVVQAPAQESWAELISGLRAGGTKVLYEADYHMHGMVRDREVIALIEALMGMCDGLICATEYVAARYARYNPAVHVCENGVDLRAYSLERPKHTTVNIGWAGGTLLPEEMQPWLQQVAGVMRARDVANFVSIGRPYGDALASIGVVAPERCLAIPNVLPEQYPAATTIFDILIDPPGRQPWRLGRSQLRWLEASAGGIPMIGDPRTYPAIDDGVTGFHASDPGTMAHLLVRLIDDPLLRASVGARAREVVSERWSLQATAPQWARVFEEVAA